MGGGGGGPGALTAECNGGRNYPVLTGEIDETAKADITNIFGFLIKGIRDINNTIGINKGGNVNKVGKEGNDSNAGIKSDRNNPQINRKNIPNLNSCSYDPRSKNTSLPLQDINKISKLYNDSTFKVNNLTVNYKCNKIPKGIIIAFFGESIPDGWVLCDGNNCTPDLRGRSLFMDINNIGEIGGAENHQLTIGELPTHSHDYNVNGGGFSLLTNATGSDKYFRSGQTRGSVGNNVSRVNFTQNLPHNNMPPYLAMNYIMKL